MKSLEIYSRYHYIIDIINTVSIITAFMLITTILKTY